MSWAARSRPASDEFSVWRGIYRAALALVLLAGGGGSQAAPRQELILWYFAATPPLYINSGPLKGQGYLDRMLEEMVIPALPRYAHRRVESALSRALNDIQRQPNICIVGLYKTLQRAALMHFGESFATVLPISVAVRRDDEARLKPHLDARGRVVLRRLLGARQLTLGLAADRSYGSELDALLAEFRGVGRIEWLSASEAAARLMQRLERRYGIDVALAYPYELRYLHETGVLDAARLALLPIAEAPATLSGYYACSRSPLGREVVDQLDRLMSDPAQRRRFQDYYERWLDETTRKRLRELMAGA